MIAMFRLMVNTSILCDDVQPEYTVVQRVEAGPALIELLPQGHSKVTEKSNQHKSAE